MMQCYGYTAETLDKEREQLKRRAKLTVLHDEHHDDYNGQKRHGYQK